MTASTQTSNIRLCDPAPSLKSTSALIDFDSDGDLDIVTAQGESGAFRNRIYINSGAADTFAPTFHLAQLPDTMDILRPYVVRAEIKDQMTSDTGAFYESTTLCYSVDGGGLIILPMIWIELTEL